MATAKKKVTIVQTGGIGGQKPGMLENLIGLGLGRIGKRSEIEDTPATRGMIQRVRHLVSVEEGKTK